MRPLNRRLAVAPALLLACGQSLPEIQWEGHNIEFGASEGLQPCGGSLEYLDDFVEYTSDELGISLPRKKMRYYWVTQEAVDQICGADHNGCVDGDDAISSHAIYEHELVHTVVHGLQGYKAHWLFSEGIAQVYDPSFLASLSPHAMDDPRSFINTPHNTPHGYDTAGEFTAYLVHRFGIPSFLEFLREGDPDDGDESLRAVFEHVYGESLDSAADDFLDTPECVDGGAMIVPFYCEAPRLSPSGGSWRLAHDQDCERADVLGGQGDRFSIVTVEIPSAGSYAVDSASGLATLGSCAGCPWRAPDIVASGYTITTQLEAGLYFLHVRTSHEVDVSITPVERGGAHSLGDAPTEDALLIQGEAFDW